jgi:hypothetical protein
MSYYHVTSAAAARDILKGGFEGGWGDDGFGVYLFGTLDSALEYAQAGGWDKSLKNPVIIEVLQGGPLVYRITVNSEWPNPEDYEDVFVFYMNADDDNARWRPPMRILPAPQKERRVRVKPLEVTLPKNLKAESAQSMLAARAKKKGKSLVAWRYDPKTGRAAYRLG